MLAATTRSSCAHRAWLLLRHTWLQALSAHPRATIAAPSLRQKRHHRVQGAGEGAHIVKLGSKRTYALLRARLKDPRVDLVVAVRQLRKGCSRLSRDRSIVIRFDLNTCTRHVCTQPGRYMCIVMCVASVAYITICLRRLQRSDRYLPSLSLRIFQLHPAQSTYTGSHMWTANAHIAHHAFASVEAEGTCVSSWWQALRHWQETT